MASLVPVVADPVNARFTFETLTAPTGYRLHFPAYDKFLKEIDKYVIQPLFSSTSFKGLTWLVENEDLGKIKIMHKKWFLFCKRNLEYSLLSYILSCKINFLRL
jgi:hypothetical protein